MRCPVYHGGDGLVHGTLQPPGERLRIACEMQGRRSFAINANPAPWSTLVTCVPCIAALMAGR